MTMTRSKSISVLAAALSVVFATHAAAADGEILINQAKVNAGGITAGDTAGFPASLTRSGRYKLSGNLVVPSGMVGIEVHANDVAVDFNGFTIRSASPGAAAGGISVRGSDRFRAINGTIAGFGDFGMYLAEGESNVVENMRIIDSGGPGHGAIYMNGRSARIRNNTIANTTFGISDCGGCLIEGNIITGASFYGISAEGGTIIGNVIAGNAGFGLISSGTNFPDVGYGTNILVGNNGGGAQVHDNVVQIHPNVCDPACP